MSATRKLRRDLFANFGERTVLLNLWATWCLPCRQEMPALDRLQGMFGSKDFAVVAVNIDTAKLDRAEGFLAGDRRKESQALYR